jgi:hypothetical protein
MYDLIFETLHEKGYFLKHMKDKITVSKAELVDLLDFFSQKLKENEQHTQKVS